MAATALVGRAGGRRRAAATGWPLAVVVLTPLAAFEAVARAAARRPVPAAGAQRARSACTRCWTRPSPYANPKRRGRRPRRRFPLVVRGLTARHAGQDRDALAGLDLTLDDGPPDRRGRRRPAPARPPSRRCCCASWTRTPARTRWAAWTPYALDGDDVRRLVGLCAQDAHLFDSSVRENLLLARKDATEAELRGALARARLLEWADALPDGLDTLVGEHGARLSGGQRQRLALARALLADFPVLVLDEPAEHLDLPTADALTADLLAATEGRTTLLITHRLAGLDAVDEVVVLDGGRVVQRGTYAELAAVDGPLRGMAEREAESEQLASAAAVR